MTHSRLLRACRRALPSCEGNAAEEALLGAHEWRALANRLAADESGCVITASNAMRRIRAILGSAIFLVIAPGIVAGYVPWRICRWHVAAPLQKVDFPEAGMPETRKCTP